MRAINEAAAEKLTCPERADRASDPKKSKHRRGRQVERGESDVSKEGAVLHSSAFPPKKRFRSARLVIRGCLGAAFRFGGPSARSTTSDSHFAMRSSATVVPIIDFAAISLLKMS